MCLKRQYVPSSGEKPKFFYVDVIWGETYANLFTNFALAARLSPRNLPAMPNNAVSKSVIVTTEEDRARIAKNSLFKQLERLMDVVFLPLQVTTQGKYDLMSTGHRKGIEYVNGEGYCLFLTPDAIIADGSIPRLYEHACLGRRIVGACGPAVNEKSFLDDLSFDPSVDSGKLLSLSPRELARLIKRHLHPILSQQSISSSNYPIQPYACLWDGPADDGFLIRMLNMHPVLFDAKLATPDVDLFNATLDWWIIPRALRDLNSYYLITDSDEFCICALVPESRTQPLSGRKFEPTELATYLVETNCPYLNRNNLLYGIKFHTGELNQSWERLEKESYEAILDVIDPAKLLKPLLIAGPSQGSRSMKDTSGIFSRIRSRMGRIAKAAN
jgi:hypothetical protein